MTLDEILKSAEIEDEKIENIKTAMKENKIYTAGEENLDIRYGKLKTQNEGTLKELEAANKIIEETKKSAKDNEELQGKISEYEKQIEELKQANLQLEKDNALKVALLSADVKDLDYISYKAKEKGEIELEENGKIKGIDKMIEELKNSHPEHFSQKAHKKIDVNKLNDGNEDNAVSLDDFRKMNYKQMAELKKNNPGAFESLKEGVENGNNKQ